jgi:tetratricopeptide (TPR) repeat protein
LLALVFLGIVAALGIRTAVRNPDWRNDDAVTLAAIAVSPDSPLALRRLGHEQFVLKNFDKAREYLERSLELNPRRTEPYVLLAQIYRQQGDVEALVRLGARAETYLARRYQLFEVAGALWQVGRRAEAERLMKRVVTMHPAFAPARLAFGGLLLEGGQPDAALEEFKTVTMLEPTNGLAWLGMGRAAESLGRAGEARAYFNRAQGLGAQ